jgi:hypothetical protein
MFFYVFVYMEPCRYCDFFKASLWIGEVLESRMGKLLRIKKTVALSLLLRCPNYSTGPLAPCWSLAPIQYMNSMTGARL